MSPKSTARVSAASASQSKAVSGRRSTGTRRSGTTAGSTARGGRTTATRSTSRGSGARSTARTGSTARNGGKTSARSTAATRRGSATVVDDRVDDAPAQRSAAKAVGAEWGGASVPAGWRWPAVSARSRASEHMPLPTRRTSPNPTRISTSTTIRSPAQRTRRPAPSPPTLADRPPPRRCRAGSDRSGHPRRGVRVAARRRTGRGLRRHTRPRRRRSGRGAGTAPCAGSSDRPHAPRDPIRPNGAGGSGSRCCWGCPPRSVAPRRGRAHRLRRAAARRWFPRLRRRRTAHHRAHRMGVGPDPRAVHGLRCPACPADDGARGRHPRRRLPRRRHGRAHHDDDLVADDWYDDELSAYDVDESPAYGDDPYDNYPPDPPVAPYRPVTASEALTEPVIDDTPRRRCRAVTEVLPRRPPCRAEEDCAAHAHAHARPRARRGPTTDELVDRPVEGDYRLPPASLLVDANRRGRAARRTTT